jgi:hypothetical protein
MDAKSAILTAKKHFNDVFSEENVVNIGLEEVRFDDTRKEWLITLGFSWPWEAGSSIPALAKRSGNLPRAYKIVKLKDKDGDLVSITNRNVAIE